MALPFGILVAIYLNEFAPRAIRNGVGLVARRPQRHPGDRDRHLRLRPDRRRARAERASRARSRSPCSCSRSSRARRWRCSRSFRTRCARRPRPRRSPRWRTTLGIVLPQTIGGILTGATLAVARVAGETAPLLLTSSIVGHGVRVEPAPSPCRRAGRDLRALGVARSPGPRARLGGGVRPADLHPRHEPRPPAGSRPAVAVSSFAPADEPAEGRTVSVSTTIEPTVRVETKRQPLPPRERLERVFDIEDLDRASTARKPALKDVSMEVYKNLVTAIIGPSGCGKSTFIRCLNRMNDLDPELPPDGDDPLPRPGHLRPGTSTRSRCAARSAWSSSGRTRSRSRSTTTSRGA